MQSQRDRYGSFSSLAPSIATSYKGDNASSYADGFQYQYPYKKRLRRQNKVITGNKSGSRLRGAPLPNRDIFVYRIAKDTGASDVQEFLVENDIDVRAIDCTSHPDSTFKSFKVTVSVSDVDKLFNEDFWPSGVKVRMFRSHVNRHNNDGF